MTDAAKKRELKSEILKKWAKYGAYSGQGSEYDQMWQEMLPKKSSVRSQNLVSQRFTKLYETLGELQRSLEESSSNLEDIKANFNALQKQGDDTLLLIKFISLSSSSSASTTDPVIAEAVQLAKDHLANLLADKINPDKHKELDHFMSVLKIGQNVKSWSATETDTPSDVAKSFSEAKKKIVAVTIHAKALEEELTSSPSLPSQDVVPSIPTTTLKRATELEMSEEDLQGALFYKYLDLAHAEVNYLREDFRTTYLDSPPVSVGGLENFLKVISTILKKKQDEVDRGIIDRINIKSIHEEIFKEIMNNFPPLAVGSENFHDDLEDDYKSLKALCIEYFGTLLERAEEEIEKELTLSQESSLLEEDHPETTPNLINESELVKRIKKKIMKNITLYESCIDRLKDVSGFENIIEDLHACMALLEDIANSENLENDENEVDAFDKLYDEINKKTDALMVANQNPLAKKNLEKLLDQAISQKLEPIKEGEAIPDYSLIQKLGNLVKSGSEDTHMEDNVNIPSYHASILLSTPNKVLEPKEKSDFEMEKLEEYIVQLTSAENIFADMYEEIYKKIYEKNLPGFIDPINLESIYGDIAEFVSKNNDKDLAKIHEEIMAKFPPFNEKTRENGFSEKTYEMIVDLYKTCFTPILDKTFEKLKEIEADNQARRSPRGKI